jgi:NAD-dependent dihydropyrimidine dehydrogenase PreA subunit
VKKFANKPKHFYASALLFQQNLPEVQNMVKIVVDNDKCNGCETCVNTCPVGVYEIKDGKSVPVKVDECLVCRACEAQCPNGAIQVIE